MSRTNEELARLHLETAVALMSREFVLQWIGQQGLDPAPAPAAPASGRGRKPGAAAAEVRCTWSLSAGGQCKNAKIAGSDHCKIHADKAAAISAVETATATGVGQTPSA